MLWGEHLLVAMFLFLPESAKISNLTSNAQTLAIPPVLVRHFTRCGLQRLTAVLGQGIHLLFLANGSLNALPVWLP